MERIPCNPSCIFRAPHWTSFRIGRGEWQTRIEVRASMTADAEAFHVTATLEVYEGLAPVITRAHSARIPRDHC